MEIYLEPIVNKEEKQLQIYGQITQKSREDRYIANCAKMENDI